MHSYLSTALVLAFAFAAALPALLAARRLAFFAELVDRPNGRKRHAGDIPLAGGLGIYLTIVSLVFIAWLAAVPVSQFVLGVVVVAAAALALGAIDDLLDLPARLRLALQLGIALVVILVLDVRIESLGNVLGAGEIRFGEMSSVMFTAFCIIGVLNAANMLDGIDGLLASATGTSFIAIATLSLVTGELSIAALCATTVGAIVAFLAFNLGLVGERRRMFLGDSGSMMLGLVLVVLLIERTQSADASFKPVVAGWFLGLPLLDTTVVMVRRIRGNRSPLSAGRDHLHHRLMNLGLSPRRTLLVMFGLQLLMVGIGLVAQFSALPPFVFLYLFVALSIAYFLCEFGIEREIDGHGTPSRPRARTLHPAAPVHGNASLREAEPHPGTAPHSKPEIDARRPAEVD